MNVRGLEPSERERWLQLRRSLWPEMDVEDLIREQEEILSGPDRNQVLVVASEADSLVGVVEVSLRDWSEGCRSSPVGYIEAWYVEPEYRRSGLGRQLIGAAEDWASSRGCTEMGSDALLENDVSHRAHRAVGYTEVERLVLFRKSLQRASGHRPGRGRAE